MINAHPSGWQRVPPSDLAAAALAAAKDVASRLRDLDMFQAVAQRLRGQSHTLDLFADLGSSCYSGHAGLADPGLLSNFPNGYLNCGMAHGIPGPLALLSLARSDGVEVPGLDAGIQRAADWLCIHHRKDAWGINWPRVYPIEQPTTESGSMRTAWCYGIPGVARALWLAGKVLDCSAYRELALAGMQSVYRRSAEARKLDEAGFCHGIAGLLQITLRFANETGEAFCTELAGSLCEQLLASYDPETLLGYQGRIMGEEQLDLPGILEGAAGNALALLAASTTHEPR